MADVFTRLVSGASAGWLSPRVPAMHEPSLPSDVDEIEVAHAASLMTYEMGRPEPVVGEAADEGRPFAEAAPASMPVPASASVPASVPVSVPGPVTRVEAAVREVDGPAAADRPELGGIVPPRRHKSSKTSPELRPREAAVRAREAAVRPREPDTPPVPRRQNSAPEPARTTVRIEIGRIEIRAPQRPAALPTPPAPAARPAEPREPQGLSLADYLRGNDGRPR